MGGANAQTDERAEPCRPVHHIRCVSLHRAGKTAALTSTRYDVVSALWEYQARHGGRLSEDAEAATELQDVAAALLAKAEVNRQALSAVPRELLE